MGMKPEIRDQWADALESGKYKQGSVFLKNEREDNGETTYCCLGVLRELVDPDRQTDDGRASAFVYGSSQGLTKQQIDALAMANDNDKLTFKQIARFIRAFL
jgi:hypothetical protein